MVDESASKQDGGYAADPPSQGVSPIGWLNRLMTRLGFQEAPTMRGVLEKALDEASHGGLTLAPSQREMLLRTMRFGELRVDDVMVPRADIIAVDESATLGELLAEFRRAEHSRLPVYHETLDDLRGMVHIKDLLAWIVDKALGRETTEIDRTVADDPHAVLASLTSAELARVDLSQELKSVKIRRSVLFVPPSMPALNLLLRMQSTHVHLAMVIDEYGGTDGLVSIEDLVEQIVGDIEDEHDDDEGLLVEDPVQGLIASARAPISELESRYSVRLVDEEEAEDIDTLGGLIAIMADRVPVRGELIAHPAGLEFEILEADPRRVKKVKVIDRRKAGEIQAPLGSPEHG
ncbi:MAG: hemolysin family protein [Hyphomicrobiaceae bacterium]